MVAFRQRRRANRQRRVQSATLPAPIGGWNARDALDLMEPTDAIRLDNYFPNETEVKLRKGYTSHATGLTDPVNSLMSYDSETTKKMFAAAGTSVWDVTATGAVGAADLTGLANSKWQWVNLGTSGGHFLWMCNGADSPRHYDGTTWATPSLTGVTATDIVNVTLHKRRLFFCFNNSLKFGYLAVNSIAGAVSEFDLSSLFSLGGSLQAIGTWTRDGGDGADDLAVFVTTNGEVAVYAGTDPATAANWSLVGVFKIGRPVGRRCLIKVGSDLIAITEAGYQPLSGVLPSGDSAPNAAISDKISGAVKQSAESFKGTFGWQAVLYPKGGFGLFNVPNSTTGNFNQHIVNLNTGAWCRFTGQDAYSWVVHDGTLYFGGSGAVFQADNGLSDNGAAINGDGKTAFQYFGARGIKKRLTLARPVLAVSGDLQVAFTVDTDFANQALAYDPSTVTSAGTTWGSPWGSPWASGEDVAAEWQVVNGLGYAHAFRLRTKTTAQRPIWRASDILWESAGGI